MDIVRILFIGLILHMDLAGSNTAVLPNVTTHEETATVYRADGSRLPDIDLHDLYLDITGAISAEGDGRTTHDDSFVRDVPSLHDVEPDHKPLDAVEKHQKVGKDIDAYVEYDGGALASFEIHKRPIIITGSNTHPRCVTCGVIWSGKPENKTITMTFRRLASTGPPAPAPIVLNPGDRVIIRNADPKDGNGSGDHFPQVFKTLKNGAAKDHHIVEQADAPACASEICKPEEDFLADWHTGGGAIVHLLVIPADCTNSQYP